MSRILIADDSIYIRETLRDILRDAGHEVIAEATSGENAVEIFKALLPDIVMLDMTMPGGSSIEALKQIIQVNQNAVVVMLTVVGKPEKVLEALNFGAKSYVTKPFDDESVISAIKKATS